MLRFAALFHTKARAWHKGRIRLFEHIEQAFADTPPHAGTTDRVWMHCASLGEFEQGRPLLEAIRARRPHSQIILTFFSPSGYEVRKHYAAADHVFYLPLDNPRHARKLLQLVRPTIAILLDSVPPDVKNISPIEALRCWAIRLRASSILARAARPDACIEEGLP